MTPLVLIVIGFAIIYGAYAFSKKYDGLIKTGLQPKALFLTLKVVVEIVPICLLFALLLTNRNG